MIEAHFYETYYFCNIVRNVLHDQFSFLRNLDEFYGDGKALYFSEPFPKYSALHYFIEFIVEDIYHEEAFKTDLDERRSMIDRFKNIPSALKDIQPTRLPIESAFKFHGIDFQSFESYLQDMNRSFLEATEDDVYDYINELRISGPYEKLTQQTVDEVFYVLFQNRTLLMVFNEMMADALETNQPTEAPEELASNFTKSGTIKRRNIPKWVKKAVYFRDRGRCVLCNKDLSGTLNLDNQENFDHIVPLARYGLNDVTNIQLLCKECNQHEKRAQSAITSSRYQSWYV
ncbi:MAG: HNH endonuclease [Haliea sp.]|nr:HNH endonuclease [Haliea sp.]